MLGQAEIGNRRLVLRQEKYQNRRRNARRTGHEVAVRIFQCIIKKSNRAFLCMINLIKKDLHRVVLSQRGNFTN